MYKHDSQDRGDVMDYFIGLAYRLLQAAGRETSRLKFVESVYQLIEEVLDTETIELFFHHEDSLYEYLPGSQHVQSSLRRREGSFLWFRDMYRNENSKDSEWAKHLFRKVANVKDPSGWRMEEKESSFVFCEEKGQHKEWNQIWLIPFLHQNQKFGVILLKCHSEQGDVEQRRTLTTHLGQALTEAFEHQEAHHACQERVKELRCLYEISRLANLPNAGKNDVLKEIAFILPEAMQFPEIATARIIVDQQVFESKDFRESSICLAAPVITEMQERGHLEIYYRPGYTHFYDELFLNEEEKLVQMVSNQIASLLERKEKEMINQQLQEQLLHADRLATVGQLSAGVAHEINEPLGAIIGFSQLIQNDTKEASTGKDLEKIIKSALYAREIIRKLLLFSRQTTPEKKAENINKVIEEGLFFLESRLAKNGIRLEKNLRTNLPDVIIDAGQVHQMLVNLTVNSMQAMPDGGLLTIQTDWVDDCIMIGIIDTGIGMNQAVLDKIFLPFFTTKDINEGTGLGLSVVHGIVTSHGWEIDVDSQPGKGTRTTIRLPVEKAGKELSNE